MEIAVRDNGQLAVALRRFRRKGGMSQRDLAAAVNMRQATISSAENPQSKTDTEILFRLLAGLNLELVVRPRVTDEFRVEDAF